MKIEKNAKDLMTPIERKKAIQNGERADRVMAMPFTSEFKCYLSGISVRDFWFDVIPNKPILSFEEIPNDTSF